MTDTKELIATLRMAADMHDPNVNLAAALRAAADQIEAQPAPIRKLSEADIADWRYSALRRSTAPAGGLVDEHETRDYLVCGGFIDRTEKMLRMTEVGQVHAALDAARAEAAHWQRVAEWLRGEADRG